ncbi:UNVERIFIED_ORG: hypothetical protein ABIC48_002274 [Burkholderia territorii]
MVERGGARAGKRAFDRDEGRWDHGGGVVRHGRPCRRGVKMSSQIVTLWSAGEGRSIRSI